MYCTVLYYNIIIGTTSNEDTTVTTGIATTSVMMSVEPTGVVFDCKFNIMYVSC